MSNHKMHKDIHPFLKSFFVGRTSHKISYETPFVPAVG